MAWSVELEIVIPRGFLRAAAMGLLMLANVPELGSESVALTAYYPAPNGAYKNLYVTGPTFLARNGGNVGVGTSSPGATLDVNGKISPNADDFHFTQPGHTYTYAAAGAGFASIQNDATSGSLVVEGRNMGAGVHKLTVGRGAGGSADTVTVKGQTTTNGTVSASGYVVTNANGATFNPATACSAAAQNAACGGGTYITYLPGIVSKYQGNSFMPGPMPSPPTVYNPFYCCACPTSGCPSL